MRVWCPSSRDPPGSPRGAPAAGPGVVGLRRRGGGPGELVGDEAAQVVGLLVDDAEELQHLGRVEGGRGAQHGGRRALDGNEGGAQLVTHRAQELGPQPLELLDALPERLVLPPQVVVTLQGSTSSARRGSILPAPGVGAIP